MKSTLFTILFAACAMVSQAQDYCIPECTYGPDIYDHITDITFTSVISGAIQTEYTHILSGEDYSDKTFSLSGMEWGGITVGENFSINLNVWVGSVDFLDITVGAWADWNDDGDFDDVNENLGTGIVSTIPFGFGYASVTINNAVSTVGIHRMRVRASEGIAPESMDPCATYFYGESIDFNISTIEKYYCYSDQFGSPVYSYAGIPLNNYTINGTTVPVNIQNASITYIDMSPIGTTPNLTAEIGSEVEVDFDFPDFSDLPIYYTIYIDNSSNNIFEEGYELVGSYNHTISDGSFSITIPEDFSPGTYNMRIRMNLGTESLICDYLSLNAGLVIDEQIVITEAPVVSITNALSPKEVSIFPNPTNMYFNCTVTSSGNTTIIVSDISGKKVLQNNFSNEAQIDVSKLATGFYTINLLTEDGRSYSDKLIVY